MDIASLEHSITPMIIEAGEIIMSYLNSEKSIENKQRFDLVTIADKKSEEFLIARFQTTFPGTGIIAEEGHTIASQNGYTFIIDPLDGTTSFAHSYPFFAVAVGVTDASGKVVAGFVYNPYYREFFHAVRGRGAWLGDQQIHVSNQDRLKAALFATGFPYDRHERIDELLAILRKVLLTGHDIRRSGSASLDICGLACGRTDAYYEFGLKPWDVCAASIILEEAGGKITSMNGQEFNIDQANFAASNSILHNELLALLKS